MQRSRPAPAPEPALPQNTELLKALHILTREGKLNQDSRRKLKQVAHLLQFITPLLREAEAAHGQAVVVDHGAGKSYLGFMLFDEFVRLAGGKATVVGVEARDELVAKSRELAARFGFDADASTQSPAMRFLSARVADSASATEMPERIDVVTALHACDTATDDAIDFALAKGAGAVVLVPCCQAEVAAALNRGKTHALKSPKFGAITELWRHPLHTREFGSQLTNVLRSLRLEAAGYHVTVTELVGWEHSMKNELIVAKKASDRPAQAKRAQQRLAEMLEGLGLDEMRPRFLSGLLQPAASAAPAG